MENETTYQQRLVQFIRYKGMSVSAFERKVGLAAGSVKNITHGVNAERFRVILTEFPELNANWLVTGAGTMIQQQPTKVFGDVHDSSFVGSEMNGAKVVINGETNKNGETVKTMDFAQILTAQIQLAQNFQKQMGELIAILRSEREERNNWIAANNK